MLNILVYMACISLHMQSAYQHIGNYQVSGNRQPSQISPESKWKKCQPYKHEPGRVPAVAQSGDGVHMCSLFIGLCMYILSLNIEFVKRDYAIAVWLFPY